MFNQSRDSLFPTWLLWIIGPVTVLAAALIILAVVLGIRAGQRQIDTQRRQQVGIALQRAIDYRAEGRLQEALAEYRQVLVLDPGNETALAGIQSIVDQATSDGATVVVSPGPDAAAAPTGGAPPEQTPSGIVDNVTPVAVAVSTATSDPSDPSEQLYQQALTAYERGDWLTAADLLTDLQQQAPDLRRAQVEDMLYNCYVNLAAEHDQAGDLEEAIAYVDKALALRPNTTALQQARMMAANYVEAQELEVTDPERAVQLLEAIYVQDPTYRDVSDQLLTALLSYGDKLALSKEWCRAAEQYKAANAIQVTPGSIARYDEFVARCDELNALRAQGNATPTPTSAVIAIATATAEAGGRATPVPDGAALDGSSAITGAGAITSTADVTDEVTGEEDAASDEAAADAAPAAGPVSGRILYSALDPVNGRNLIYVRPAAGGEPTILAEDGQQPSFRPDGQRLVFRNLDSQNRGISSLDPASGLRLRFTEFAEDGYPSWNAQGNLIAFASNREGDRRWRVYVLWADVNNEATSVGYGQAPDWHPAADLFVYQGCDETGNACGLRTMTGSGGDQRQLTSVAADTRPDWSPTGSFVAFMSEGRDGNAEIYRVDVATGQVTRLTEHGAMDVLPVVSPDGAWVAFMSNRSGAWAVWAVPSSGGEAQQLFAIDGGIGAWQDQAMQWLP